ncbi:MAG: hypothetical protein A3G04_01770 [Candidatus Taylorbacteria bacterium RIFCSPLOWO2_12_FULL_44_9]|nr:MAG: hypothetical protein A3G04_01770 [Candidatus Taylorbacteria bacterium RIFCSPLOWO2_12_FULL_44_9]
MTNEEKENVFKYSGPSSLKDIEARLLELDAEKSARIHNAKEDYSGSIDDEIEADDIAYLDIEKTQLQLKRQFILDERNSWKAKSVWNVVIPIAVSIITAYLVSVLVMR